jgi:hypothetical protein
MPNPGERPSDFRSLQAVAKYELKKLAQPRLLRKSKLLLVHGHAVASRHERRAAESEAKRYGCDPASRTHNARCPQFTPPQSETP